MTEDHSINTSGFTPRNIRGHQWKFVQMVSFTGAVDSYIHPLFECTKCNHSCWAHPKCAYDEDNFFLKSMRGWSHFENGWEFSANGQWCTGIKKIGQFVKTIDINTQNLMKSYTVTVRLIGAKQFAFRLSLADKLIRLAAWIMGCKYNLWFDPNEDEWESE